MVQELSNLSIIIEHLGGAGREGCRNALRFPMEQVSFRSQEDRDWVFGRTAASIWKFGQV